MGDDDGGDHMKDAGLGLPPGVKTRVFPSLELENGAVLRDVVCAYSTYGELSATRDNVVVVGHSLTSNSCVHEWWGEMLGDGAHFAMNTREDFVVCVNYLGSPYGTASPITMNPATPGRPYGADFPTPCTIRDNVRLQKMLLDAMGVAGVKLAIGGSMGCMLALEWGASYPSFVSELCLIAGCGRHSDWATGIGECERFAIMADGRWNGGEYDARDPPLGGLAAARMTAMLTYRSPAGADEKFGRRDASGTDAKGTRDATKNQATKPPAHPELGVASHSNENATTAKSLPFTAVESYLQYQGRKFTRRFDANCYVQLTYTLDSHDVSRGREGSYEDVMRGITQRSMVVGITSDVLYPFHLQREMVRTLPNSRMFAIDSVHGHDGFLLEIDGLNKAVRAFRDEGATTTTTTTGENLRGNAFADDANPDYDRDPLPPAPSYGAVNVGVRGCAAERLRRIRSRRIQSRADVRRGEETVRRGHGASPARDAGRRRATQQHRGDGEDRAAVLRAARARRHARRRDGIGGRVRAVRRRARVGHEPSEGAFRYSIALVPIRPRRRGERRSLRTFAVVSLRPPPAFNPRPRCLSTPTDAFQLHLTPSPRAF